MTFPIVIFDSLRLAHSVVIMFQKQVPTAGGAGPVFSNTWKWTIAKLDAGTTLKADTEAGQAFGFVSFDPSGTFQSATTSTVAGATAPMTATDLTGSRVTLNFANGQAQGQQLLLDFTRVTQSQGGTSVLALENNGLPTVTRTPFPTSTRTATRTPTMTPTVTFTRTPTVSPTVTVTRTPTVSPTVTVTRTPSR
jgi:hypothetical protein